MSVGRRGWMIVAVVASIQGAIAVGSHAALRSVGDHPTASPAFRAVDHPMVVGDAILYYHIASRVVAGRIPYRDDPLEYPPLALPFLLAPRAVFADQAPYCLAFGVEMLGINALTLALVAVLVARREGPGAIAGRLGWSTAAFVFLSPFVIGRYDPVPALFAIASVVAWDVGRPEWGGGLAAVGTLAKVVPGAAALPRLMGEARALRASFPRGSAAFAAVFAAGVAGWFALGGARVVDSITYHTGRGVELGSVASGALRMAAAARGAPASAYRANASENLRAAGAEAAARAALPLQAMALFIVAWRGSGPRAGDPLRWAGASVLAFLALGKVLSPQYLVWFAPFAAAIGGRVGRWVRPLFVVACAADAAIYPWLYRDFIRLDLGPFAILNLRNALLLAILAILVLAPAEPVGETAR